VRLKTLGAIGVACIAVTGCGTLVPQKTVFQADTSALAVPSDPTSRQSYEGRLEEGLVANIKCELTNAFGQTAQMRNVDYLTKNWGTQVTIKLTWDEISNLAPGVSFMEPLASMQSRSIGFGVTDSAHATRVETITFLFENGQLLNDFNAAGGKPSDCSALAPKFPVSSDLKIGEFVVDKAFLAGTGEASTVDPAYPPYSTFQEDLTFVAAVGGNVTPTWKLTRFTANTSGNMLAATRTTTGDILITLGPLATDDNHNLLPKLADSAAAQHTAGLIGGAVATQNGAQSH
jgi:hypothetical protein